jgi:hypothetical protein
MVVDQHQLQNEALNLRRMQNLWDLFTVNETGLYSARVMLMCGLDDSS